MTDDERAEMLARALDDLIRGIESPDGSHGLEDDELASLLQVAEDRLDSSKVYREEAATCESEIWQRVSDRITGKAAAQDIDLPRDQHDALSDIIALRMQMAREVLDVAESHRDEVWRRLQFRMGTRTPGAGPTPNEIPIDATNESDIEAITRRSLARLAEIASDPVHIRFRERLSRDVALSTPALPPQPPKGSANGFRITVSAAVAVAITAVVVSPLLITGIEGHPAIAMAESFADRVGLTEPEGAASYPAIAKRRK